MHVAIIGMGALGRVYGVRLAAHAACAVTFVVRPGRTESCLCIRRIDGDAASDVLESPKLSCAIPSDADVVLVCVRAEQLDAGLDAMLLAAPEAPVLTLTPVLPPDFERLTRTHGERIRAGMPGVAGYVTPAGECRYWLPRVAPTMFDSLAPVPRAVDDLVTALRQAGFGARLEPDVRTTNPATTISFIPLAMGMDAAGGIAAVVADRRLLRITLGAAAEGRALAAKVGRTPKWIDLLARFAGPISLRVGVSLARKRVPEVLAYVEEHFGRKLHAQNVAMAKGIIAMADATGSRSEALRALLDALEASTRGAASAAEGGG
jgi:2-dehydropantoate 2-reductase